MKKNNLFWSAVLVSATILTTLPAQNAKADNNNVAPQLNNNQSVEPATTNNSNNATVNTNSSSVNPVDSQTNTTSSNNSISAPASSATTDNSNNNFATRAAVASANTVNTDNSINTFSTISNYLSPASFLSQIKPGSISGWQQYHILPSITAAQAILESGWGNSQLAQQYHNLFGIKGSNNGQSVTLPTNEEVSGNTININAQFRAYPSWAESITDHGVFLNSNSRYHNILGVTNYRQVAQLLQQDGYATSSSYAQSLINIIESNNLQAWDQEALGQGSNNSNSQPLVPNNNQNNGTYTFTQATNIYTSTSTHGQVVGQYQKGQTVIYNDKIQAEGLTWLRYTSYSGKTCYVPISSNNDNQATTPNTPTKNDSNGVYTFQVDTNIRTSPSLQGTIIGRYATGQHVYYNGKVNADGYTWLKYLSSSGKTCYVAMVAADYSPLLDNSSNNSNKTPHDNQSTVQNESGVYTFPKTTNIYTETNLNSKVVGHYAAGQRVFYNGKVNANGTSWLRYLSYSGTTCYVPLNNEQKPASSSTPGAAPIANYGTYTFKVATNIRLKPSLQGKIVGSYNAGQKVFYNGKVVGDGYTWLYYLSYSGTTCYVAVIG